MQNRWTAVIYLWFATAAFICLAILQEGTVLKVGWTVWAIVALALSVWRLLRAPD